MSHPTLIPGMEHAWILTASGRRFNPLLPNPEDVDIQDIAHALSHIARFNGHTRRFYSVAQHSVMASYIVPAEHAMAALLHDATEAYIADITRPVKPFLRNYQDIEANLWSAIAARFGLADELPIEVKHADLVMLATERRDLMPPHQDPWECLDGIIPLAQRIATWAPEAAKDIFLSRFEALS